MDVAGVWEVDRLATADLLASLKTVTEAEWPNVIARAFAKARVKNYEWAAQRVRDSVIDLLEAEAVEEFQRKEMSWTDGFMHAEGCIAAQTASDLLDVSTDLSKSKGQVLRSLIRSARQQSTLSS